MSPEEIRETILTLTTQRGQGKTICPSEVARQLRPDDWRPLMQAVRDVANELQRQGKIRITQKGVEVDPKSVRGAIRLGLPD